MNLCLSLSLFEALGRSEPLIDAIQTAVGCQVQQDVHLPPGEVLTMIVVLMLLLLWLLVLVLVDNTPETIQTDLVCQDVHLPPGRMDKGAIVHLPWLP